MRRKNLTELKVVLKRGIRSLCPSCGEGKLFRRWNELNVKCSVCGCPFQAREDETWFFMYVSTAFITGLFIICMFLIVPMNKTPSRIAVSVLAFLVFILSTGPRKGIALAIDYFIDSHSEFPKNV